MAKQTLNHDEVTYGVRFCWYDHPNDEGDKRFDTPRRVQHVNTYGDRGIMPSLGKVKDGVAWSLYRAKDFINRFMNCGLPEKLMTASEFELVKMMVMTDKISVDQEGQIQISWHDLDLWVEVVRLNQVNSTWMVGKTMARWEVLAKSFNEPFFPPEEMDPSNTPPPLAVALSDEMGTVTPFVCPLTFRHGLALMLKKTGGVSEKFDGTSIECYGLIINARHAVLRIISKDMTDDPSGVLLDLTGQVYSMLMTSAVCGDPVASKDVKAFWTEPDASKAIHLYHNWFKTKHPELA